MNLLLLCHGRRGVKGIGLQMWVLGHCAVVFFYLTADLWTQLLHLDYFFLLNPYFHLVGGFEILGLFSPPKIGVS